VYPSTSVSSKENGRHERGKNEVRDCQFLLVLRRFDYNAFGCLLEAAYISYDMIYFVNCNWVATRWQ